MEVRVQRVNLHTAPNEPYKARVLLAGAHALSLSGVGGWMEREGDEGHGHQTYVEI